MNTPSPRLPLRESHPLFTLSDVAILAGAVVVVTGYAGHWHAATPSAPAVSWDLAAGAPHDVLQAYLLERAPHPAIDQALSGLLPATAPASPAPHTASGNGAED